MADPLSSFSGVSSGVDWKALVEQIMTVERRPAAQAQAAIDANAKRKDALGQFQTALGTLKDAADALVSATPFETFAVNAAGGDATGRAVLAATVGAGAAAGSYAVQVTQLAAAHKVTAGVGRAPAAPIGAAGTLTVTRPGTPPSPLASVEVAADDTLATVRDKINARNTGATPSGVQAAIVAVSATEHRLVLTSTATGAANAFALADDGTSGLLGTLGLDPADADAARRPIQVAAADARFTVDGLAVSSPGNTAANVIPGVTLALGALGASTVTVTRNEAATTDAVRAFVDGYNKLQKFMGAQSAKGGALANDGAIRSVRGRLPGLMLAPAASGADDLKTLAAVGVSVQRDGTLKFDEAAFKGIAPARLGEVQQLFGDRMAAMSAAVGEYSLSGTGVIDQREQAIDVQNARHQARIDTITARLDKKRTALLAQYAKFESSLGKMRAIGDSMSAQFAGLNKSNS